MTANSLSPTLRSRDTALHWIFLATATVVLALSFVLRAPGGERVLLPGGELPLPGVCTFKRYTGLNCPGCGLTRSFISIAHGDLNEAWRYNPAGLLLFPAAVFQVPFRSYQIWRLRRGLPERRWPILNWGLWLLAAALVAQWVARLVFPTWLSNASILAGPF